MRLWLAIMATFASTHPQPGMRVYGLDDWRMTVATDTFTRQTMCRIAQPPGRRHGGVALVRGALVFRFDAEIDTADAWYALDDAPPRPWRALQPQLIAAGAMAQAERLDNPSGGRVAIPLDPLAGAHRVTIRPAPHHRPATWRLDGLDDLMASARGLSCDVQ